MRDEKVSIARQTAVFDGEILCVDGKGRPRFNDLLFRRRDPVFFAFDLLYLKRQRPPLRSTRRPQGRTPPRVLNARTSIQRCSMTDDVSGSGVALYERVCEMDLEGIVAKHKTAPYLTYHAISTWHKIRSVLAMVGHELFDQERHSEPFQAGIVVN